MRSQVLKAAATAFCLVAAPALAADAPDVNAIETAVNQNPHRTDEQKARDVYRHPVETLAFFGLRPDMTVIEPLPGWYTEILGVMLKDTGTYIAVNFPPDPAGDLERQARSHRWRDMFIPSKAEVFGPNAHARFLLTEPGVAAPGSVDAVLAMRVFHGWVYSGKADEVLAELFRVLKPGGVLGIVQHREDPDADRTPYDRRGYLKQDFVIGAVENAGFELVGTSEINANPDDTKDYDRGVWALPPSLAVEDPALKEKHREIGESDRMTLKFIKPTQ